MVSGCGGSGGNSGKLSPFFFFFFFSLSLSLSPSWPLEIPWGWGHYKSLLNLSTYTRNRDVTIHLHSISTTPPLRTTTCLKTPLGPESRWLTSSEPLLTLRPPTVNGFPTPAHSLCRPYYVPQRCVSFLSLESLIY